MKKWIHASDDWYDFEEPELEEIDSYYMLVDRKDVQDSDGFSTKYSLYRKMYPGEEDIYVTVFGDPDIYHPEDGYFDAEFDNEAEAIEWFENYEGLVD